MNKIYDSETFDVNHNLNLLKRLQDIDIRKDPTINEEVLLEMKALFDN